MLSSPISVLTAELKKSIGTYQDITSECSRILMVTHPTTVYDKGPDENSTSKAGLLELIKWLEWQDPSSIESFLLAEGFGIRNQITSPKYIVGSSCFNHTIDSGSGEHWFTPTVTNEFFFAGGILDACLKNTMTRIVHNWKFSERGTLTINIITDATYYVADQVRALSDIPANLQNLGYDDPIENIMEELTMPQHLENWLELRVEFYHQGRNSVYFDEGGSQLLKVNFLTTDELKRLSRQPGI